MNQLSVLDFIIFSMAAYRLTHLLVFDKIVEPIRNLFVKRDFSGPVPTFTLQGGKLRRFIGKLLNCHWCAGIWVAGGMALTYRMFPGAANWIFLALAAAAALSLIETAWLKIVGFPEMREKSRE